MQYFSVYEKYNIVLSHQELEYIYQGWEVIALSQGVAIKITSAPIDINENKPELETAKKTSLKKSVN